MIAGDFNAMMIGEDTRIHSEYLHGVIHQIPIFQCHLHCGSVLFVFAETLNDGLESDTVFDAAGNGMEYIECGREVVDALTVKVDQRMFTLHHFLVLMV